MRPSIGLLAPLLALAVAAAEAPTHTQQPAATEPATQQSKSTDTVGKKPAAPAATNSKPPQSPVAPADESTDVFKPSENISEDAAIPYPADI